MLNPRTPVRRLLKLWQKRLAIQDWKIGVEFVPASAMEALENAAEVRWHPEDRTADIKMAWPIAGNLEDNLVHELLHVLYEGHAPYKGYNVHMERAHNQAAAALVEAYERKRKSKRVS